VPQTALQHFREDIGRARAIIAHADGLARVTPAESMLRSDLLRSAWMFAVGAIDAYFSDAYADIVAATALSKQRQSSITLPDSIQEIKVPIRAVLETYEGRDWRWRMAAREMVDATNFLSLESIQKSFNPFFRKGHRFFGDKLDEWIRHPASKIRLFGMSTNDYLALGIADRAKAREKTIHSQFHRLGRTLVAASRWWRDITNASKRSFTILRRAHFSTRLTGRSRAVAALMLTSDFS